MENDRNEKTRILVVDDEDLLREFICDALGNEEWEVNGVDSDVKAMRSVEEFACDILICDIRLGEQSGIELAAKIRQKLSCVAIIFITGYPEEEHIRHVEELEASFLTKPVTAKQLRFSVLTAIEKKRNHSQPHVTPTHDDLNIVGTSPDTLTLRENIRRVGPGQFPILISGPSGTGKELVAQAIHRCSSRASRPMITINCAAIPKHLEEAEFFGYTRGAFTGADIAKHGIFASAENSTLFLDEVGELSLDIQAKLLRVLDTGEYRRIGETQVRNANVRIVSATNRDMDQMIGEGTFRKDLYYRLKGAVIKTLPLCDRREDIPSLVKAFIQQNGGTNKNWGITADALSFLMKHEWAGNVRELKHTMTMLCHLARGLRRINMSVVGQVIGTADDRPNESIPYMEAKEKVIRHFENDFFTNLVQRYDGNLNRAAKATGMHRPNLIKKLRALKINPDHFRPQNT